MKTLKTIRVILKEHKDYLISYFKVKVIGIFGSYSRHEARKKSDIDILVEFSETPDFFEFIRLEEYLQGLLGMKIDLVTRDALKPVVKNAILRETKYI